MIPNWRQYSSMCCDVLGVAPVVDEDDVHLASILRHLVEAKDVVAGLLERQMVDVVVLVAFLTDVDEHLVQARVEQRFALRLARAPKRSSTR